MLKKTRTKRLYIILGIIILGILIVGLTLNSILNNIIENNLDGELNKNPQSLYLIAYEKARVNVFSGTISLKNIQISPTDSANTLLENALIPSLLALDIPSVKVTGIRIRRFIRTNEIHTGKLKIRDIDAKFYLNPAAEKQNKKNDTIHAVNFPSNLRDILIKSLEIKNTDIEIYQTDKGQNPVFSIDSVTLKVEEIRTNPEIFKGSIPVEMADLRISTGHFSLNSMRYYRIFTRDLRLEINKNLVKIDGFRLIPRYGKEEYNKQITYNNDWFSINTQQILISGLNISEIIETGNLNLGSIEVKHPEISIYRDKRLPDAPFNYKPLLAGMINKIPVPVKIDTIRISEGKLEYEEQVEIHHQPGRVFFDPLYISIYQLTNNDSIKSRNPVMEIDFRAKIMAEAFLDAKVLVDLQSIHEEFKISGTLEPVDGTVFNPMIEKLMPAKIKSASISKTEFSFQANDDVSSGQLTLEYQDLKMDVTKAKEDFEKKSGFLSGLANTVIRKQNSPEKGKYITGTISFQRRKDKAIVNFLWNSVKTGLISIIAPIAAKKEDKQNKEEKEKKRDKKKKRNRN